MTRAGDAAGLLRRARSRAGAGDAGGTVDALATMVGCSDSYRLWRAGAAVLERLDWNTDSGAWRDVRVGLLSTYATAGMGPLLRLAGLALGLRLAVYEAPYAQHDQEILDPDSGLYRFGPNVVLLAAHAGSLDLPMVADDPEPVIAREVGHWTARWQLLSAHCDAHIVQHNLVAPGERPLGHLSARLAGSRERVIRALNDRLADAAGDDVSIVDCEWLASTFGIREWQDERQWHLAKQAVAPAALPVLSRHTAAVIAARLGLTGKCLVMDLDDTLWGGVVGEVGVAGIRLGDGAVGEAHVALQEYIGALRRRGVILAVCSKNNPADAIEVFERHPDMRLSLDDIAVLLLDWGPKPDNLRRIAQRLGIGTDALVLLDDNPAEREAVRQLLPEVAVVELPADPTGYRRALDDCLALETAMITIEDAGKSAQYRARADIAELEDGAASLEDFWTSLRMKAKVAPIDELALPRVAQLLGKTNQFNLTSRRHGFAAIKAMVVDPAWVHLSLRMHDRFADHGLVGVLLARQDAETMDIDTFLLSCRVIGRTLDAELLMHLCRHAVSRGCTRLQGAYVPTARNGQVAQLYGQLGFDLVAEGEGASRWEYDLAVKGPIHNPYCGNG